MSYFYLNSVNALLKRISPFVFKHYRKPILELVPPPLPVVDLYFPEPSSRDGRSTVSEEIKSPVDFDAVSAFVPPAGYAFPEEVELVLENELEHEKKYIITHDYTEDQWRNQTKEITRMAKCIRATDHNVANAKYLANHFLKSAPKTSCTNVSAIASASILVAAGLESDDVALSKLADFSGRSAALIKKRCSEILKSNRGLFNAQTTKRIVRLINNLVLEKVLSKVEMLFMEHLQNTFLKKWYTDGTLTRLQPSSVAFSVVIVTLAIIDPNGEKSCNFADITFLAAKLSRSTDVILTCLREFTQIINQMEKSFS